MNRKVMIMGAIALTLLITTSAPEFAETGKDTARIEKLEERTRDLEARLAKVEAATHKQMGMMQHDHATQGKGMGTNNAMGQMPQQAPQQNMPPQQQGGGMPSGGGMGDM